MTALHHIRQGIPLAIEGIRKAFAERTARELEAGLGGVLRAGDRGDARAGRDGRDDGSDAGADGSDR